MKKLLFIILLLFCNVTHASLPEHQEGTDVINDAESVISNNSELNNIMATENNNDNNQPITVLTNQDKITLFGGTDAE